MTVQFKQEIEREWAEKVSDISKVITSAAKKGWTTAVNSTAVDTGRLRAGWRLSTSRRSSYVPRPGRKGRPRMPKFKYRASKDKRFYLWNNVPYAYYQEEGIGPGRRVPRKMLKKARLTILWEMQRGFNNIR